MPKPRKRLVNLNETSYYHCISRCVRRAFLCGQDSHSGRCYEHRQAWVEERLLHLAQCFAIEVCAYAVMSNHVHLVLNVDTKLGESWSDAEVVARWQQVYKPHPFVLKMMQEDTFANGSKRKQRTGSTSIAIAYKISAG